jgi:dTDP-3-amino-2,3,6-trideoxy-4-keto-D-glucose/dTDP-3-amino-3,4,6-trideoxy-alpha-D-glucose/dTDP-2,6-dideoxy-D-kanosamine transaminase
VNVSIPRFDYREQYRLLRAEILRAVDEVIESGCLILGPKVQAFEAEMCRFLGDADGHCVGVGSGTDALAIALRALKIGAGDEVITVANTAVATVSAIRMVGAVPVFCDVDRETLLMDPASAQRRITKKTKAIMPVHLFGNAVDMAAITRLAGPSGLHVIEDCAQSCGTVFHGRATGTWGDIGCFSFYPTKNLGAYGDGGLCFTRSRELAESMRQIRNYGFESGPSAEQEGVNSRLDELHAAILRIKLRHLPEYLQKRRSVAAAYSEQLTRRCVIPRTTAGVAHSYHLFVVQTDQREGVISRLRSEGIECGIHYTTPIHLMNAYRFLGCQRGSLPVTEEAAERILSLPCFPELSAGAIQHVCAVVNDALGN